MHSLYSHCTVSMTDSPPPCIFLRMAGRENLFEVMTPGRTFYVQVDSSQDMEDWIKAFNDLIRTIKPTAQQQQVGPHVWEYCHILIHSFSTCCVDCHACGTSHLQYMSVDYHVWEYCPGSYIVCACVYHIHASLTLSVFARIHNIPYQLCVHRYFM